MIYHFDVLRLCGLEVLESDYQILNSEILIEILGELSFD